MSLTPTLAPGIGINVATLLETRLLVQASSGGGKSWALRRLLEQTANHVQHLIIDPEGEFATLRAKFDYIVAAPHDGDALAHPRTAGLLARRLLETGVSAVIDIYDLKAHDRQAFVRLFCEAMVNAPRALWRPALLVIDEAHVFCAEGSRSEATGAVIDVVTRGRKRGFGTVLATQRLSKLHKDAAAEMLNKLVGRTGLDIDVKRAADELGMSPRDAMDALRSLQPGEFFAFGPALSPTPMKIAVGAVTTMHPKAGERMLSPPPAPSAKIRAVLKELADLPAAAEEEARTVDDLRREVAELKRRLTDAGRPVDTKALTEAGARIQALTASLQFKTEQAEVLSRALVRVKDAAVAALDIHKVANEACPRPVDQYPSAVIAAAAQQKQQPLVPNRIPSVRTEGSGVAGPLLKILNALAKLEAFGITAPEKATLAAHAGYRPNTGTFNTYLSRMKSDGQIEYPGSGRVALTDAGRALASAPGEMSPDELQRAWLDILDGPLTKIMEAVIASHPEPIEKTHLAAASGYQPNTGTFNTYLSRLKTMGAIHYPRPSWVAATEAVFPK